MAKVGLIGAGLMGYGIGKNILAKGHGLVVMANRNREPIDKLKAQGASEAASPKAIAEQSDMVITCVTASPQMEDIVYRADGLLAGLKKGQVVADATTAEPSSTRKIAASVEAAGGRFCDIPMTRTPKDAEAGKLGLMTGGDPATLAEIRPVLECFADTIVYSGPVGSAHVLKLVNNFLSIAHAAIAAEAIVGAAKAGVDMNALKDIVLSGGANSVMFARLINVPLSDDDSHAKFAIDNACKDMRYYTNLTENLPYTSFLAEQVHQTLVLARNRGYGQRYVPRLIDFMAEMNGVTFGSK
jgi:3-hydroxyisobutyrate dehydrogenase-like beta-hydroxyacid dehydrogenase